MMYGLMAGIVLLSVSGLLFSVTYAEEDGIPDLFAVPDRTGETPGNIMQP